MTTFFSPDKLLEAGIEYVQWCKNNPLIVKRTGLSKGVAVKYEEEQERPPSIVGFASHLGVASFTVTRWFHSDDPEFREAAIIVKDMIQSNQITGGMAGIYNPMIVSRLNGLAEKVETTDHTPPAPPKTHDDKHIANIQHPDCTTEQMEALLRAGLEEHALFSQAQIDNGMPFIMPELPE